jgi:chromosome segregation ATPase
LQKCHDEKHGTVIPELKAKIGNMKSEITHLNACAEKKNASIKNKNTEIDQMRLAMKAMIDKAACEAQIEELKGDYTAQISALQGTMSKLQEDILREQGENQAKAATLKNLEEEKQRHVARLTKLEPYFDKFITLEREKEGLMAAVARLERRVQEAEAKKSEMYTLCGKLTDTTKLLEKQLEKSKSQKPPKQSKQPKKMVQFSDPLEIPASATKSMQTSMETVNEKTSHLTLSEQSFLVFVCITLLGLVGVLLFWKC